MNMVRWRPMEELIPRSFFRGFWDEEVWDVFEKPFETRELEKYNWAPNPTSRIQLVG